MPQSLEDTRKYLERYLQKFTSRLKCNYLGTVIKEGVEGIQVMPSFMTKKGLINPTRKDAILNGRYK